MLLKKCLIKNNLIKQAKTTKIIIKNQSIYIKERSNYIKIKYNCTTKKLCQWHFSHKKVIDLKVQCNNQIHNTNNNK